MKIKVPHLGVIESCFDDSCDGAHYVICGGHFIDFYQTYYPKCQQCETLSQEQEFDVMKVVDTEWKTIHPE